MLTQHEAETVQFVLTRGGIDEASGIMHMGRKSPDTCRKSTVNRLIDRGLLEEVRMRRPGTLPGCRYMIFVTAAGCIALNDR